MAVSPQLPEHNATVRTELGLEFSVLNDADNAYARSLGLTFRFSDELRGVYEGFGVDLPALHGSEAWELPLPTRLVLDAQGVVVRIDADPDYTRRPDPAETLAVLRGLG